MGAIMSDKATPVRPTWVRINRDIWLGDNSRPANHIAECFGHWVNAEAKLHRLRAALGEGK